MTGTTLLVLAAAMPLRGPVRHPAAPPALVFDGVTVIDVEHGQLLPARRVVVTGNRIQAVGPADRVPVPSGAQVVDAKGKYLIPGLWDMHTHSTLQLRTHRLFYDMFIASGVTGIRDASSSVPLDTLRLWRRQILAGTRVGPPRQVLSGPMIQTYCEINDNIACVPIPPDSDSAAFHARIHHVVDSLKSAGADMIKLRDLFPATTFLTIADEAKRVGIPFGGHVWDSVDVEASNHGARIIDHLQHWYDVPSSMRVWCWAGLTTANLEKCKPVAERFKRNHTWVVPTVTIYVGMSPSTKWSYRLAKQLRKRTAEFFAGGLLPHGNWIRDTVFSPTAKPPVGNLFQENRTILPDSLGVLRFIQATDFPIAAGTDVAPQFLHMMAPGFTLHTELAIYVAEGLTPLKALQSATLEPAKLLRATDSLGTVAAGKLADLVLLDANPLADIANTTTIRAVVANGRYFDRAALDQLLNDARAAWKEAGEP